MKNKSIVKAFFYSADRVISRITTALLVVMLSVGFFAPSLVFALSFTAASDTMSTQAVSTAADHTVAWTLASGHTTALNAVITVDFNQTDFAATGTWQTTDFAFTDNVRSSAAPATVGTGAATCSGSSASNYIVNVNAATATFTITTCTGWTTSAATTPTTFLIKGATGGTGILTNQAAVNSSLVTITDTINDTDSTTLAVAIATNDVVTVTATVNPSLTFSVGSSSIALGTLTTSAAGSGSHTIDVATNGAGGFALAYTGATLTGGGHPMTVYTSGTSVPGTEGFGINLKANTVPSVGSNPTTNAGATCTPSAGYGTTNQFSFVAGSATTIINPITPSDCSLVVSYVANITGATPAGAYATAITYTATGTF